MRVIVLLLLLALLPVASMSCATSPEPNQKISEANTVVLVLVEDLTWKEVRETSSLARTFDRGAVANLSTFQGAAPPDPGVGYVLLGAGSRVDTSLLPGSLPKEPAESAEAFSGPAAAVIPGSLGEALSEAGLRAAAVGEKAFLVAMDREGRVPIAHDASEPLESLEKALAEDADFIAVQAKDARQADHLATIAGEAGTRAAIASPNASTGPANLTPFTLGGPGEGLLYSPTTHTKALIASIDVAPTILAQLGVEPPPEMQGRPVTARSGEVASAEQLGRRLFFVTEQRGEVWIPIAAIMGLSLMLATSWRGKTGARFVLLTLAMLPAGALISAAFPVANAPAIIALTLAFGGSLTALSLRFSDSVPKAVALSYLIVAALILADTAFGGPLMKLSTLGYNPAYGTRFYGIGNEYSAFLAGSLTMGLGALTHWRRLPLTPVLVVGFIAVVVLGLPTMGADVGGSLALGLGFGVTIGLLRGGGLRRLVLWTSGGVVPAAALFLTSGLLFPGVSHGSRVAGGETSLAEILVRKLLLSLDLLLNPVFLPIFMAGLAVVFLVWLRTRRTAIGAGLLGATITAVASGALNDSGILAAIYVLAYPAVASGVLLLSGTEKSNRVR